MDNVGSGECWREREQKEWQKRTMTEPAKRVLQLHEERVAVYRRLEEAFRSYLLDEQEMIFGMAVQSCTADFARISREVMAAGAEGSEELRGAVGRLQKVEQAKLAGEKRA